MMKRLIAIAVLLLTAPLVAVAQIPANAQIEQELRKIIFEMSEAHARGDRTLYERYLADDYIGTNIFSKKQSKADVLGFLPSPAEAAKKIASSSSSPQSFEIKDVDLRSLGDVVVLNYQFDFRTHVEGQPKLISFRVTDVFVRFKGSWQLKANHRTLVPTT